MWQAYSFNLCSHSRGNCAGARESLCTFEDLHISLSWNGSLVGNDYHFKLDRRVPRFAILHIGSHYQHLNDPGSWNSFCSARARKSTVYCRCHKLIFLCQQFWKSPFNVMDLILTAFCAITLLVLAFAKCGAGSKEEEIFDTLLLIARNVLQFGRLAAVMRQFVLHRILPESTFSTPFRSGQSIFSRPKPIDINTAHRAGFGLDLDMDSDDDELNRPLVRNPVLFDAGQDPRPEDDQRREPLTEMPRAAQAVRDRDVEDVWAELG